MVAEGNQAECVNELGSFSCMCIEGFQKVGDDQVNCHNVNECQSLDDACGDHSACTDLLGAFQCTCDLGFEVNSQQRVNKLNQFEGPGTSNRMKYMGRSGGPGGPGISGPGGPGAAVSVQVHIVLAVVPYGETFFFQKSFLQKLIFFQF